MYFYKGKPIVLYFMIIYIFVSIYFHWKNLNIIIDILYTVIDAETRCHFQFS